jgi:hypothetical protein
MGTDIYLSYDGQTDVEKDQQVEVLFESSHGDIGYLRAAIWMQEENGFLRRLFPPHMWRGDGEYSFNFDENYEKFNILAEAYELGVSMDFQDDNVDEMREMVQLIAKSIGGKIHESKMDDEARKKWLGSVRAFFKLGHELQKMKKNPKICISW